MDEETVKHVGAGAKGQILEAAIALFAARGFDGASFRDITERCGAKRSLILYHYGSKEELWREALRTVLARVDAALEAEKSEAILATTDDRARTTASLRTLLDVYITVPEFGQIIVREGSTPGERLDWIVANFTPSFALVASRAGYGHERVRSTMVRDLVIGSMLAATALGPFLEASTSAASHRTSSGIYPMDEKRRDELVDLLIRVIFD
jgi:AcrR family transcriptional regulator